MSSADAFSKHYVSVNTRDRDCDTWPNSNDFEVSLGEELRDVKSVSMRGYNIPDIFPVAQGRDTLWVELGGTLYEASAPVQYTARGDAAVFFGKMAQALRDVTGEPGWAVGMNSEGFVVLSADAPFVLIPGREERRTLQQPNASVLTNDGFGPRAAGRVMGFARGRAPSSPGQQQQQPGIGKPYFAVVAPYKHQFDVFEHVYLHIDGFGTTETTERAAGLGANMCHEVMSMHEKKQTEPATRRFHPPVARVRRIKVCVVDYYGLPANLYNRDCRFELIFTCGRSSALANPYDINDY